MKVLVACEESQRVCSAFRAKGHEAYSCDLQECSGGHPEWHITCDCLLLLNGYVIFMTDDGVLHELRQKWDLIIAHPPCTYLSNAGNRHLRKPGYIDIDRYEKVQEAASFFKMIYYAHCDRICVENPVPTKLANLPPYDQIIHPYYFGEPFKKRTCLWLKGLPFLKPTNIVSNPIPCASAEWFNKGGVDRQKNRSKTFLGIAEAMAEQWG